MGDGNSQHRDCRKVNNSTHSAKQNLFKEGPEKQRKVLLPLEPSGAKNLEAVPKWFQISSQVDRESSIL